MTPCILLATAAGLLADAVTLTVSAAASLKGPLERVGAEFEKANPDVTLVFNFGSSGSLQQQIANGAPADIFISAASKQMDDLQKADLILAESRFVLLSNTVVLVAPLKSAVPHSFDDLRSPDIKHIAIGEPKSVPAGTYAIQVLGHLGLDGKVKDRLVFGKDVRQVLVYVETGNVDAGIVYGSDVAQSQAVRVVQKAPSGSYERIEYPAAMVKTSLHPEEATLFLEFLRSPTALALFKEAGFVITTGP